ncbi:MAG: transcription elongation factor GreA [Negativicutes bacterium]|jgi:transcription elongation factor GreA
MAIEKHNYMTADGFRELEQELDFRKNVKRRDISERLNEAIALGDISENAEYEDSKNEQALNEGRVFELERILQSAEIIIVDSSDKDHVRLGSRVILRDMELKEDYKYELVGTNEADPLRNKISNESPVGVAVLGKKKGNTIIIKAPAGSLKYKIVAIDNSAKG